MAKKSIKKEKKPSKIKAPKKDLKKVALKKSKKTTSKKSAKTPTLKRVKEVVKPPTPKKVVSKIAKKKISIKEAAPKKKDAVKKIAKKKVVSKSANAPKRKKKGQPRTSKGKSVVRIKVIGVGGGGGNALTRMSKDPLRGVEFIAVNTDVQDLESCGARKKIHIGKLITRGMGAGMNPELGQQSAEESRDDIENAIKDADMLFITAGMGGGTGTGAAPVIAEIARDMGILTVAVVTKPFTFEGSARMKIAEDGLMRLRDKVDTLLVIPNDKIFNIIDDETPVLKAFDKIDEVLKNSVTNIAEGIASSGLVNVDFADVSAVMKDAGMAVVGVGVAKGKDRAVKAVNDAVNSPLLEISVDGARGVLFIVSGGRDMRMSEINEVARMITETVDVAAKIIFGAYYDRKLNKNELKVTVIATGFNNSQLGSRDRDGFGLFTLAEDRMDSMPEIDDTVVEVGSSEEDREDKKRDSKTKKKSEVKEVTEGEEEDVWEIPAFLRKRKRR